MSTFLNQKEQVLDIELTPEGKRLLSLGKFSPAYYAFYDGDILYNGAYAGLAEEQNNIVQRIKNETPRLGVQTNFTSSIAQERVPAIDEHTYATVSPSNAKFFRTLGNGDPWSDYTPAWRIVCQGDSNTFEGGVQYKGELAIPSFSSSLTTKYAQFNDQAENVINVIKREDRILLDVEEINTIFKNDGNFEIEVYRVRKGENEENTVIPLFYIQEGSDETEGLKAQTNPYGFLHPFADSEESLRDTFPRLNNSYVEYYLSVRVDAEITDIDRKGTTIVYAGQNEPPSPGCDDVTNATRFGVD